MPIPAKAEGNFELKFRSQQKFELFGMEYAKCYANMDVKGMMDVPEATPEKLTYDIRFRLDCGCDTVLANFKRAYDKTFSNHTGGAGNGDGHRAASSGSDDGETLVATRTSALIVEDRDWTGRLMSCALPGEGASGRYPLLNSLKKGSADGVAGGGQTVLATDLAGEPWLDGYALGKGVNAVTGNLAAQAIGDFTVQPATNQSSLTQYTNIMSSSDVEQQIQVSASGSYNMDGVNLTASTSYLSDIKQSELDMTILATYEVSYNDYDSILTNSLALTPAAQDLVNQGEFDQFRGIYGDYYIAGSKRWAFFRAIYTLSAESESDLMQVQAAIGANAPEMFTAQGQAAFQQAVSSVNVSVNLTVDMQGYNGTPPPGPWTIETVTDALTWFQANANPIPVQAEMIHYSQIDNSIPTTLPIDPTVFGEVSAIYLATYLMLIAWGSLPDGWQNQYEQQVLNLRTTVNSSAQDLVIDDDLRASMLSQVEALLATLTNLYQRSQFISSVQSLQSDEPGINSRQSGTNSFGSINYANAQNDPSFVIQSTAQNYSEGGHVGHRNHTFNLSAGNAVIVQWEVHAVWEDGTDGTWWKTNQQNNSQYILLNSSAIIDVESDYDRGFDYTVTIWYVDQSLLPPLG